MSAAPSSLKTGLPDAKLSASHRATKRSKYSQLPSMSVTNVTLGASEPSSCERMWIVPRKLAPL
eukprot:5100658-Prymnesium_polylepis.1